MKTKTTVGEFIKYLEENKLATVRLITALNYVKDYGYFIEDITKKELTRLRGTGKKTTAEYLKLRADYLEKKEVKIGYDHLTREELIERIKELEYLLHREKRRLKTIVESAEYELKNTIESIKSSVERYEQN